MVVDADFEFDVFISYSHRDKAWVRGELLERIEKGGLRAFVDFRDFTPGAPSIKNMEHGAKHCRHTLLVLTPDYISSEWCDLEGVMSQTLSPANRDLRVIPLLKADCEKPLYVGALTNIDFTDGADIELAWRQLLTALGAPPEPEPPKGPHPDHWFLAHPYPMPPNFTGRVDERAMLTGWLGADVAHPLLSLRALGGFGKSALAWHWLTHDVKPADWPRVVWWSFYEGDASFDNFVAQTLDYLSDGKIKPGELSPRDAVKALLEILHPPGTLLVLDGFERELRAFGGLDAAYRGDELVGPDSSDRDCISPVAEGFLRNLAVLPNLRSKVLLTTRLSPHALETRGGEILQGCREEELKQMQPADAVGFFHAQGIRGTRTEIERVCEPYGYHPLSLRLLAGLIVGDLQQPGDIAAAKRLDVGGDLKQHQHHVLEVAYDSLTSARRALLSRIACLRGPVRYDALEALAESPEGAANILVSDLRDLVARGLLRHDTKASRFDLHPIVRRYAYDRLSEPDRTAAHSRLRDYFAAVPPPEKVTRLEDLAPVIELYDQTIRAGQFDQAMMLFRDRLYEPAYDQFAAYQICADLLQALLPDGEERPPRLEYESAQTWTLNALGNSYSLCGQPRRALSLYEAAIGIAEKRDRRIEVAVIALNSACVAEVHVGAIRAAEANLYRSIRACQAFQSEARSDLLSVEALGHRGLGWLLACRGAYAESEAHLAIALGMLEGQPDTLYQGTTWGYRALRELLLLRSASRSAAGNPQSALDPARRALELADETARAGFPHEFAYVRAHWLLGAAHRVACQPDEADRHLNEALERCRRTNAVEAEADILIELARLRSATGASEEAQQLAEEAMVIAERSDYVLQGADAHLELAKLGIAVSDRPTALEHARDARRLATCDGPPDFTYKAAYDEASEMIAELESYKQENPMAC